jgi:hypothetical protein
MKNEKFASCEAYFSFFTLHSSFFTLIPLLVEIRILSTIYPEHP